MLGVKERVVIERNTHGVEVFVLSRKRYMLRARKAGGWHAIQAMHIRLRVDAEATPAILEAALDLDGVVVRVE